jgi:hypothetical protein
MFPGANFNCTVHKGRRVHLPGFHPSPSASRTILRARRYHRSRRKNHKPTHLRWSRERHVRHAAFGALQDLAVCIVDRFPGRRAVVLNRNFIDLVGYGSGDSAVCGEAEHINEQWR